MEDVYKRQVLQHLVHHGRNALLGVLHGQHLATVRNIAAAGNNVGNIALHNQLILPIWGGHKGADDLAGIVKGDLVRLLMPSKELRKMHLPDVYKRQDYNSHTRKKPRSRSYSHFRFCSSHRSQTR